MTCPRCRVEHPAGTNFCGQCAAPLAQYGDAGAAESHYRQALAPAEPRGTRPLIAHCHFGLGKVYQSTGKAQQAQEHLAPLT